ncbi:hypothetical protein BG006_008443, partial [Podila minutissima]
MRHTAISDKDNCDTLGRDSFTLGAIVDAAVALLDSVDSQDGLTQAMPGAGIFLAEIHQKRRELGLSDPDERPTSNI